MSSGTVAPSTIVAAAPSDAHIVRSFHSPRSAIS